MSARQIFIVFLFSTNFLMVQAQDRVYPPKKSIPTEISPELFVVSNDVVEQQWKDTLSLVNPPSNLQQVEPGQCIRFGVFASGDDRDRILSSLKIGFELSFSGHNLTFAPEPPEAVKQAKPEGGDFVSQALGVAGVEKPALSMASLAASKAKWCVPVDATDGTATIRAELVRPNGTAFALNSRRIDVKTLASARQETKFSNMNAVGSWLQQYYMAPDPAAILPALRIVASDAKAKSMPNFMFFFVTAFKASPEAMDALLRTLPTESQQVRMYTVPLLSEAGYKTESLVTTLPEEGRTQLSSVNLPDPFDFTPDRMLPSKMDMLWANFFASGRIEPVRKITSMLAWKSDYDKLVEIQKSGQKPAELTDSLMRGACYTAAGWSLNALSLSNGLVADYIEAIQSSPDTPPEIKTELKSLYNNPAFRNK